MKNQLFGDLLREVRGVKDTSLRALAVAADMDPAYLSRLETGKTGSPKPETVEKLAKALCDVQGLGADECERQKRRLMVAAGLMPGKEELLDDLSERFAALLRDKGIPEPAIDSYLAQVPLATMRAVLLGEEPLEVGNASDFSQNEIEARKNFGEEVYFAQSGVKSEDPMPYETGTESAADYLDRHASQFVDQRRARREKGVGTTRRIRAGRHAMIEIDKPLTKVQEQQLKHISRLIDSLLRD